MKTACGAGRFYKTGLPVAFGISWLSGMTLCFLLLTGTSANAQKEQTEIPVYNTQMPVYNAPADTSRAPVVRQRGSVWAHPAPPTSATHDTKKNKGTPFKPRERKAPFSAGPGLFADTCNAQKEITNPKLIKICASYKDRPLDTTAENPSPSPEQK